MFRQQLRDAELRAQLALGEAENLRKIVAGLEGLSRGPRDQLPLPINQEQPAQSQDRPEGPRGQEAVRQVMMTAPDQEWSLAAITGEILKRAWIVPDAKVPEAAIRAATQRLAGAGLARKSGPGRYRLTEKGRKKPG
jgi:hypothetical protein